MNQRRTTTAMTDDKDTLRVRVLASFWAVVLLGLPLWYTTTTTYRAPLPFDQIDHWAQRKACDLEIPVHVTLHVPTSWNPETFAAEIQSSFDETAEAFWKSRTASSESWLAFPVVVEGQPLTKAEENYAIELGTTGDELEIPTSADHTLPGHYHMYMVPEGSSKQTTSVIVDKRRFAVVRMAEKADAKQTTASLLASFFVDEQARISDSVWEIVANAREEQNLQNSSLRKRGREAADSMRTVPFSSRYRATFSLMNANPADFKVSWDISKAIEVFLRPMLRKLSVISDINVESQVQYYATLPFTPSKKRDYDAGSTFYSLSPDVLPSFINSAEWNLASAVTSDPTLNFLLYVPSSEISPLVVLDSKDRPVPSNAFLIPRWGGIVVDNRVHERSDAKSGHHYGVDELRPVMEIFVSQLRGLLGVSELGNGMRKFTDSSLNVTIARAPTAGITDWELDGLIRKRTAQNIVSAVSTLKSLGALVRQFGNMVVLDHIRDEVHDALRNLEDSCQSLPSKPTDAFRHSRDALIGAEKAFFDPTMVSLLYFPDEHKYAIYMPLFIPVSVPLVLSIFKEIKRRREKGRTATTTTEKKKKAE